VAAAGVAVLAGAGVEAGAGVAVAAGAAAGVLAGAAAAGAAAAASAAFLLLRLDFFVDAASAAGLVWPLAQKSEDIRLQSWWDDMRLS